jgi:predicted RNA polymerase sigma factor
VESIEEYRWMFAAEYPAVVRTVYLVLHDYARSEEIAQDAFVQLLRHWEKVRRYEAPEAWVRHRPPATFTGGEHFCIALRLHAAHPRFNSTASSRHWDRQSASTGTMWPWPAPVTAYAPSSSP